MTGRAPLLLVCITVVLGGCAVGPDFGRPPAPPVDRYTADPARVTLAPGGDEPAQRLVVGHAISAQWWELFGSRPLVDAVDLALAGSPTLAAAEATLAQGEEAVTVARAAFYPHVDLTGSATRQHRSSSAEGGGGGTFNLFSLGPSVSYSPDVFGGTRRHVEQAGAQAESQRDELAAAYLALTGNVVSQAIAVAGARLEIGAAEEIIADDERNLDLVRAKLDAGKAAETDVLTAESQLATDQAQLPPLLQQLSAARDAFAVLVGRFPAEWSPPDFDLVDLTLPGELPLSIPSELVRQRPDILAAEATLHAASAAVGVATANLYPSFTLSASVAQEALDTGTLFTSSGTVWSLASGVTAPVFEGGALRAARRGAVDAYDAAFATYRQTVLQAFGQVADVLQALGHDADLVAGQRRALDVADRSRALQRISYGEGKSDLLRLLDAERLYQQARLGYARAEAQRHQDTAALFVAMGGGWWERGKL
ncbi:MAG TPA: efflux transporter outer membrane subunit [Candidatus Binatia bacterium]|nr:efflux transporter outer membrane subunit [Candidatus Binatia bacterium]